MKILKYFCFLILIWFGINVDANAQDSTLNSPLIGIWQLHKIALGTNSAPMNPDLPTLKVFDSNGTLSQVIISPQGALILQKGVFEIIDSAHFNDIIYTDSRKDFNRAGKKNLLTYKFFADGKNNFMTLEGFFENNSGERTTSWKELWRKVEILPH